MIESGYNVFQSGWTKTGSDELHISYVVEHHGERFADDYGTREMANVAIAVHRLTGRAPLADELTS